MKRKIYGVALIEYCLHGLLRIADIGDAQQVLALGQGERVVAILVGGGTLVGGQVVNGSVDECLADRVSDMSVQREALHCLLGWLLKQHHILVVLLVADA